MRLILLNIARFILLILLQVLVVNQIDIGFLESYVSLMVYTSFILTFPLNVSKYTVLVIALFLGLAIDMFMNTNGIHTSSCLLMAFARPVVLRRLQTESPIEEMEELTVYTEDTRNYVFYCLILSFIFFFWLFLLEEFSFSKLPLIVLKSILSCVFSTVLIILGQYLLIRKPKL